MLTAILPEPSVSSKTPELDNHDEGTLVIRLQLNGEYSSEILANQSETQERLTELLECVRPTLNDVLENYR